MPRTLEDAYLDPLAQDAGELVGELEREYSLAGVKVSTKDNQPPDHVSVELEYMSFLCDQEAADWEAGNAGAALDMINRQLRFLEHHLSLWIPSLARMAAKREEANHYTLTLDAARALVIHDTDFTGIWCHHVSKLLEGERDAYSLRTRP